jgi:class 3 adenylate cyclase/tetratricopeptide (TPR) repeat protein
VNDRAERKVVSVLFADLVGFTARAEQLDPEDVRRLLVPYYSRVRLELERFGGTVEKFIGDAVMALFGAPVAHEDDPERAVRAAFALRDAVAQLNEEEAELDLHVRVAVNTGEVVVAADAQPLAAGDVINTAFRLQEGAPRDGILVSEATRDATHAAVEYRAAPPLRAKGKSAPVPAWEAVALKEPERRPRSLAPLVGRRFELRVLVDALERARSGAAQLVTVVGEPGLGKSRLVWELCRAVEADPEPCLWRQGRCAPYGSGPFGALGEVLKAEAGILDSDPHEAAEHRLAGLAGRLGLGEDPAWVRARLRPLLGLGAEPHGPDRRMESFTAWRRVLEAVARSTPLVVALEDVHWADDALLEFVEHVFGWAGDAPLLLLCSARPELLERRPGWPGTVVQLRPLGRADSQRLLRELTGRDAGEALLERVDGNPLYAEEYARMAMEHGGDVALPPSVQAVIAARLDALPPGEKQAAQEASVIGQVLWPDVVAAVASLSAREAGSRLEALARRQLLRPHRRSAVAGQQQYAFSHVLVREVAYEQITRERRGHLHERAARWIESLASGREEERAEMLAHHYERALAYARSAEHLHEGARHAFRSAGDRALSLYAFAAALRWFRLALALWPDDGERAQLLFRYGKATFWAEGAGEDVLAEARDALVAAGDDEGASEAEVLLSRLFQIRGAQERASALAQAAASRLDDAPPSRSKAAAISNLSSFLMIAGRPEEAIALGRQACRIAEQLGLEEIRAHSLTNVGIARVMSGDVEGVADLEQSAVIAESLNSPVVVREYANLGSLLVHLGRLARAWDAYGAARRAAERFGDARGLQWLAAERVYEHYWRAQWDEALALADGVLAGDGAEQYPAHGCRVVRGWIGLAEGALAGALDDSRSALDFARAIQDPQTFCLSLALRARACAAAGLHHEAQQVTAELLELLARDAVPHASFWTFDFALALAELGRSGELDAALAPTAATPWVAAARLLAAGDLAAAADAYRAIGALAEEQLVRRRAEAPVAR